MEKFNTVFVTSDNSYIYCDKNDWTIILNQIVIQGTKRIEGRMVEILQKETIDDLENGHANISIPMSNIRFNICKP